MAGELKRLEMVARNLHVPAPRTREDVRVSLDLLERAAGLMRRECDIHTMRDQAKWLADYRAAKGE